MRIVQIGDSHTASDAFSGRLREMLQARFGTAGRGWLPAGIPFKYYQPRLVAVSETGWRRLGAGDGAPAEALGIDAAVACSEHPGAEMTIASVETEGFTRAAIEFLAQPYGGQLVARVDRGEPFEISTAGSMTRSVRRAIPIAGEAQRLELRAVDRQPVHMIGWTIEHARAGVVYENHGTIGATVRLLGQMHRVTVADELSDSGPALIVIAFGTNEGFDESLDLRDYGQSFARHVRALARMAPKAAILVLGPPDGSKPNPGVGWCAPPHLAAVRRLQQALAADHGWPFWDWCQAMGGAGSMQRLAAQDPPLALADRMHLNRTGYSATAEALYHDLISAYEAWKSQQ